MASTAPLTESTFRARRAPWRESSARGAASFWDAWPLDRRYVVISSVLGILLVWADASLDERPQGSDLSLSAVIILSAALLLQWWSSTRAFAMLLPVWVLTFLGASPVVVMPYVAVLFGAVIASATRRFIVVAVTAALAWALGMGFMPQGYWGAEASPLAAAALCVGFLVLGGGTGLLVRHNHQRKLADAARIADAERRAADAAHRERRVLARDLHDIVAHNLTIISMQAKTAEYIGTPEAAEQAVRVVGEAAQDALVDLRRMLALLREEGMVSDSAVPGLSGQSSPGSAVDLRSGVSRVAHELMDLGFQVQHSVDTGARRLPLSAQSALYRVLQEAGTNVAKHGDKDEQCLITVSVSEADTVVLQVRNRLERKQGRSRRGRRGAGADWNSSGVGLVSMRDRVEAFGGTLDARMEGEYWLLRAVVPLAGEPVNG